MSIFGNTPQNDTQNAMNALMKAQNGASTSLSPYTTNAGTDFNNERNYVYGGLDNLSQYDPMGHFYGAAEMNPEDLLNQIMSGYSMSLGAQNQLRNSLSAANNVATTTGMYGSGDDIGLNAEIANQITGEDEQQYLGNILGVTNEQDKFGQQYTQQMQGLMKALSGITGKEFNASNSMANIDKSLGEDASHIYAEESRMPNHQAQAFGVLLGGLMSALIPGGKGKGGSSGNSGGMGKDVGKAIGTAAMFA